MSRKIEIFDKQKLSKGRDDDRIECVSRPNFRAGGDVEQYWGLLLAV